MSTDLATWLRDLGLDKYTKSFAENDIDLRALPHLTEEDLRELGVSLGHRKILMAAIQAGIAAKQPDRVEAVVSTPALMPGPAEKQAERRLLSVLFCDLVGSTKLARELDPEDMRDILHRYHDQVAQIISRYGGHPAKFMGDGIMAYFGWPLSYEDHAERAIRAGIEAIHAVPRLRPNVTVPLQARIGIATGRVVIGDLIGSAWREEGAIAGETPNLASRLQAEANASQLIISESTRRLIGETFIVEDLGARRLKGFEIGIRLYRVVAERDVESRFQARHGTALAQFTGRVNELAVLHEKWALAKSGEGQTILISGEAGIGKSRLVQAFLDGASEAPAILRFQCSPYHTTSALFPVIHTIARTADFETDDSNERRLEKLERMLAETGAELETVVPVYAELLSLDLPHERYCKLDLSPEQRKSLTFQTIIDRLLTRARRSPLLLFVEDAHWIDPTTRELMEALIAQIEKAAMMLVVTHRPNWDSEWANIYGHVSPLSIGRLPKPQVTELIKNIAGPLTDEQLISEITARTDGIPLFIEELTRSLIESRSDNPEHKIELPATLQGSLMARLDRLSPDAKTVAQIASAIGREFSRNLLGRVCGFLDAADSAVAELLEARLVLKAGTQSDILFFKHALIQDAAYQSLLIGNRQKYHEAIARALAAGDRSLIEAQPEIIARHFSEAALPEMAFPFWEQAGKHAVARSANYEAVDHCQKALLAAGELPDPDKRLSAGLEANLALGEAQAAAGQLREAMTSFQSAGEVARRQRNVLAFAKAAIGFDHAQFYTHEPPDPSMRLLTEALSVVEKSDSHERCQLLVRLARALHMAGEPERAEQFNADAIEMARRLRDDRSLYDVLIVAHLTPTPVSLPQMQDRRNRVNELLALAQRVEDVDRYLRSLSVSIYFAAEAGDLQRIAKELDEFASMSEQRQMRHHLWVAQHGRAMQALLAGDFDAAEKFAEAAYQTGSKTHGDVASAVYGVQMFTIRREQGRLAEVAPVIKRFIGKDSQRKAWRPGFALIASDLGFAEQAQRILDELRETNFDLAFDAKRSTTLSYLAEVCASQADRISALRLYELLEPYRHMTITAGIMTVCYGSAGRFLGELAHVLADWDKAEEHFEHALHMNEAMQAWPWLAHTQHRFARMLRSRGRQNDIERVEYLLSQSWTTANRLGMIALKERLRKEQH